jgi:hypothetical protein
MKETRLGELIRPHHSRGPDKKSSKHSSDGNADDLRAEGEKKCKSPTKIDIIKGLSLERK